MNGNETPYQPEEAPVVEVAKVEEPKIEESTQILDVAQVMPEFEGGMAAMYKWLGKKLNYPEEAQRIGKEGKVVLSFVIEKNGEISDLKIIKSVGFGCDEEAIRVVKKMPKWKPGMQGGRPVRVRFVLPLSFKLS